MDEILGRFGKAFAQELAKELAKELRSANDEWVSQVDSPLGNRRHCAAVRRRIERGAVDASIVGTTSNRRFLLTREALNEELMGICKPPVKATRVEVDPEPKTSVRERLLRKLGR